MTVRPRVPHSEKATRLTVPQKRHLVAMLDEQGLSLYWHPANSGEQRCIDALKKKGLLRGSYHSYHDAIELTDEGLRVARELKERRDA